MQRLFMAVKLVNGSYMEGISVGADLGRTDEHSGSI